MTIKYKIETSPDSGVVCCKFRFGDLYDVLDKGRPKDQEELLVYIARIMYCLTYDVCFVGLMCNDQDQSFDPEHEFSVQYWRSSSKPPISPNRIYPFFKPELLESIYSFKAYHADRYTVQEVIEQCLCSDLELETNPDKAMEVLTFYQELGNYSMISPPDLILPHDSTACKAFYQYRTKTAADRFDDADYCNYVRTTLRDILRVLRLHLYADGVLFCPYFDDVAGMYRHGCVFVSILCNDVFYYASSDAENIPVHYFDQIMSFLEEETSTGNYVGSAITAVCSWLRRCQLPLERYRTPKFQQYIEQLCMAHGKPWEIVDAALDIQVSS